MRLAMTDADTIEIDFELEFGLDFEVGADIGLDLVAGTNVGFCFNSDFG